MSTTYEVLWLKDRYDLLLCHTKIRVCCDTVNEIILSSVLLDLLTSKHWVLSDLLMKLLTVAATLNSIHHDILCCHEWNLLHEALIDNLVIYHKTINNVQVQIKDSINCEECLWNWDTLICWVIQCSLKPLCCGCDSRIERVAHYIIGKWCDSLTSHWISLVCHSWWTDLVLLKWLLYLL